MLAVTIRAPIIMWTMLLLLLSTSWAVAAQPVNFDSKSPPTVNETCSQSTGSSRGKTSATHVRSGAGMHILRQV
jgi:hypothetical protein